MDKLYWIQIFNVESKINIYEANRHCIDKPVLITKCKHLKTTFYNNNITINYNKFWNQTDELVEWRQRIQIVLCKV